MSNVVGLDEKKTTPRMFQPGGPPGPGRPPRQTEAGYLRAMMTACNLDTWREICAKAVVDALAGDAKAREWLAKYLIGDPGHQAPAPMQVIIQQLTGQDAVLDRASEIVARVEAARADAFGLALTTPGDIERAKAAILQAEAADLVESDCL